MHLDDGYYMALALAEARKAAAVGEVPVGAVVVLPGQGGAADRVLAAAHNQPIGLNDPTAHAEMLALRAAAQALGNYRLDGCELYVTLEPCAMCAQALLHARVARVVYGAREPKTGAAGSVVDILGNARLNHQTTVQGGVQAEACADLMQAFFAQQRRAARQAAQPLREDALRTPDDAFEPLWQALSPEWREASKFTQTGSSLDGLRLHWVDCPPTPASAVQTQAATWVLLHDAGSWWPQWLPEAEELTANGQRVLLPDLIGHGLSDKPKKPRWHTISRHAATLAEWLLDLGVTDCKVGVSPEQLELGQELLRLLHEREDFTATLEVLQVPRQDRLPQGWQNWPYPDKGHQAAWKAWPWPF